MFRSPFAAASDDRVFYVFDKPECLFSGNAYRLEGIPVDDAPTRLEPGISFFDRPDQQHMFKLHLPYIWRTDEEVDTLFLPLINRDAKEVQVQCGLVETDWYASSVNLIIAKATGSLHYDVGEPVAHAILISRGQRTGTMKVAASHSRLNREARKALVEWEQKHWKDRSVYKMLARERKDVVDK